MRKLLLVAVIFFSCLVSKGQSIVNTTFSDSTLYGTHTTAGVMYFDVYKPVYKLMRRNDSVFARSGGEWVFQFKDSIGIGGGGSSNKVDTIYRTPGKDSIQFTIDGRYHAIKDSSGGGGGGSGVTTVGTFSGSSQTNGASISGSTITFGPADGTNPGMVSTGTQTFAGVKTFTSSPTSPGVGSGSERFGSGATAGGANGVAIGNGASAGGSNSAALGQNASAAGASSFALGSASSASQSSATAIGVSATASGINSTSIGSSSTASGTYALAIGQSTSAGHTGSIAIGQSSASTATGQLVIGSSPAPIANVFFDKGVTDASPGGVTINASGGSGTNIAGGTLTLAGGKATGNAAGGNINFQTSTVGSSGTTLQTLATRLTISPNSATYATRVLQAQGADVASANNLSLGTDGNTFEITGTTQINLISNTNWQNGSEVTLLLASGITIKHGQATSGSNITISLSGAADLVTAAETSLTLVLSEVGGTQKWRQKGAAISY